jgi:hypothetical protein
MFLAQKNSLKVLVTCEENKVSVEAVLPDARYERLWNAIIKTEQLLAGMHMGRFQPEDREAALLAYFNGQGWAVQPSGELAAGSFLSAASTRYSL